MEKQKQRFVVQTSNNYVLQKIHRATEEQLASLVPSNDYIYSNVYRTALEAKLEMANLRTQYLRDNIRPEQFEEWASQNPNPEQQMMRGELAKTLKWINKYIDIYPYIFI